MAKIAKNAHIRVLEMYERSGKDPVKVTALVYLKEALLKQQYEVCADIVAVAKEFGATDAEVRNLLEDPRRSPG